MALKLLFWDNLEVIHSEKSSGQASMLNSSLGLGARGLERYYIRGDDDNNGVCVNGRTAATYFVHCF